MSDKDDRFEFPLEFVKKNLLGCFEASKACCQIPGKPHLFHVEFLRRANEPVRDNSAVPVDHYLESHWSPCPDVSWYLHQRSKLTGELPTEEADPEYIEANADGLLPVCKVYREVKGGHLFVNGYCECGTRQGTIITPCYQEIKNPEQTDLKPLLKSVFASLTAKEK